MKRRNALFQSLGLGAFALLAGCCGVVDVGAEESITTEAKGGGGNPTLPPVTMAVSPSPPQAGQAFIVSGTGFIPNTAVNFYKGGAASYAPSAPWGTSQNGGWQCQ